MLESKDYRSLSKIAMLLLQDFLAKREMVRIKRNKEKKPTAIIAPIGMVTIQETRILRITAKFNASIPLANPTPSTAPINVWVAETGNPKREAIPTIPLPNPDQFKTNSRLNQDKLPHNIKSKSKYKSKSKVKSNKNIINIQQADKKKL